MADSTDSSGSTTGTVFSARGIVVDFAGVRALDHVDFTLRAGEIHALLGENGAGKSTLIKVLSGSLTPGAGTLAVNGKSVRFKTPRDAEAAGVSTVYQEIDLVPTLSVADNLALGRQSTRFGLIRRRSLRERIVKALARLGLDLDVDRTLGEYPIATQQIVAIARALDVDARVLILDEPTSSLDRRETLGLFDVLRRLRDRGLSILFVTHFLEQVYELCDRITVLRDGARIGGWLPADLDRSALIEAMTGRTWSNPSVAGLRDRDEANRGTDAPASGDARTTIEPAPHAAAPPRLEITNLARHPEVSPTSVTVRAGEAIGLAGLLGSGRTELARLIFGATRPDAGSVAVEGQIVRGGSILSAIQTGIGLTPEDRKAHGLVLDLSVRENILLALQARRGALRPIRRFEQVKLAEHYIRALRIRTPSPESRVGSLSGGNQQKVLLARWLATQPRVLILDEPTRGIDVGARAEIEALIAGLRRDGIAIVLVSSELDEIVRLCSKVIVLRDRRPIAQLEGADICEAVILATIAGAPRETA